MLSSCYKDHKSLTSVINMNYHSAYELWDTYTLSTGDSEDSSSDVVISAYASSVATSFRELRNKPEEATSVIREHFVNQLLRNEALLADKAHFAAWTKTLIYNKCKDISRTQIRHQIITSRGEDSIREILHSTKDLNPREILLEREREIIKKELLDHLFSQLPKKDMDLLFLIFFEKYRVADAAKSLDMPQRTAYHRLRKSLSTLRKYCIQRAAADKNFKETIEVIFGADVLEQIQC